MLKGIPNIISPDLMKILMEMGHGDELVLADGNFPAATMARRLVRADGLDIPPLLSAVLQFFPLDQYVDKAAILMQIVPGDPTKPTIWNDYRKILQTSGEKFTDFEQIERHAFYQRARELTREHGGVGNAALNVVAVKTLVERDRLRQLFHGRVGLFLEPAAPELARALVPGRAFLRCFLLGGFLLGHQNRLQPGRTITTPVRSLPLSFQEIRPQGSH